VGGQSDLVYLPTTLALRGGHFRQQGVDVTIDDVGAGSKALQAVLGRSADVATGFYDHTIHMAAEKQEVRAFVTLTRYPGAVLLTSPDGAKRIRSIPELRHKVVGVTAPGSSSHFFLNYLLIRAGVSTDDVKIVALGGGRSRVAAVEHNKIDAAVVFEPAITLLERRAPGIRVLVDTRTAAGVQAVFGTEHYPSAVLYATGEWLRTNADRARRLAHSIRTTLRWIAQHPAKDIAEQMPDAFRAEDPDAYVAAVESSKQLYSSDGRMDAAAAEAVRRVLAVSVPKVANSRIDLSRTYTNEFLTD
jgi:NitT/TauT family transport system substrate-binding protein